MADKIKSAVASSLHYATWVPSGHDRRYDGMCIGCSMCVLARPAVVMSIGTV
jgi:formate hydrogenlyase subunit 6/NADH:ubiquinone oxidoreductase subunit I